MLSKYADPICFSCTSQKEENYSNCLMYTIERENSKIAIAQDVCEFCFDQKNCSKESFCFQCKEKKTSNYESVYFVGQLSVKILFCSNLCKKESEDLFAEKR